MFVYVESFLYPCNGAYLVIVNDLSFPSKAMFMFSSRCVSCRQQIDGSYFLILLTSLWREEEREIVV